MSLFSLKNNFFKYSLLFCTLVIFSIAFSYVKRNYIDQLPKEPSRRNTNPPPAQSVQETPPPTPATINKEYKENQMTFLEENKKKEGVQVTSSGLQYKILRKGQGASPKISDQVEVHYQGTLTDGVEFDSSYKRKETTTFRLRQVIPGWTEGLQLMKEGSMFEFYIPSELAYGARDLPQIPAYSTLIFRVELIKVL